MMNTKIRGTHGSIKHGLIRVFLTENYKYESQIIITSMTPIWIVYQYLTAMASFRYVTL